MAKEASELLKALLDSPIVHKDIVRKAFKQDSLEIMKKGIQCDQNAKMVKDENYVCKVCADVVINAPLTRL